VIKFEMTKDDAVLLAWALDMAARAVGSQIVANGIQGMPDLMPRLAAIPPMLAKLQTAANAMERAG
jgi:hypothetical protein